MTRRQWLAAVALAMLALTAIDAGDVWARARGGGSRGYRTPRAPARPAPVMPGDAVRRPAPAPATPAPARPSAFGGGLLGGLGGFMLGGLLGGLLFGGLGHGAGIGLLDLLVIGGGLYLLMSWFGRRRPAPEPAYAGAGGGFGAPRPAEAGGVHDARAVAVEDLPAEVVDLERGVRHVRLVDPGFDPAVVADLARAVFADVQRALGERDATPLRDRLTPEMLAVLRGQCDELRAAGRINRVESIRIDRAEPTEVWQESGRDWVTVYLAGSLIDWIADERSGALLEGSRTERQAFEEFWTFTRPVGPNPWRLAAIQTA